MVAAEEPVGEILSRILAGLDRADFLTLAKIRSQWRETVGLKLYRVCQAETLNRGKLTVVVSHPSWIQHLGFLKDRLISNINQHLSKEEIKEVYFRIGRLAPTKKNPRRTRPLPLSDQEKTALRAAVAEIEDESLQEAVYRALARAWQAAPDRFENGSQPPPPPPANQQG